MSVLGYCIIPFIALFVIPMFAAALISGIFRAYRNRSYTTAD